MKISLKFDFIRDYFRIRRGVFTNIARQIGVLEWLINDGNGLRNDNRRAIISGTIKEGRVYSFKTKKQRKLCDELERLYNEAVELYEKKRIEFLSKI